MSNYPEGITPDNFKKHIEGGDDSKNPPYFEVIKEQIKRIVDWVEADLKLAETVIQEAGDGWPRITAEDRADTLGAIRDYVSDYFAPYREVDLDEKEVEDGMD